jgi:hypothetical protein
MKKKSTALQVKRSTLSNFSQAQVMGGGNLLPAVSGSVCVCTLLSVIQTKCNCPTLPSGCLCPSIFPLCG